MPKLLEDAQGMYMHAKTSITNQVPPEILALDGRRVVVAGLCSRSPARSRDTDGILVGLYTMQADAVAAAE